jgi:hypothetical protein
MNLYEEFEQGVGTYLKVIRFAEPTNPDGFVVLYLRPGGRFLMAGYWRGYEGSAAAGRWVRHGSEIRLDGTATEITDTLSPDRGAARTFSRILEVRDQHHTPVLVASGELAGWSLLGWSGPFMYVGRTTIIDPDGQWLPGSTSAVDEWIDTAVRD